MCISTAGICAHASKRRNTTDRDRSPEAVCVGEPAASAAARLLRALYPFCLIVGCVLVRARAVLVGLRRCRRRVAARCVRHRLRSTPGACRRANGGAHGRRSRCMSTRGISLRISARACGSDISRGGSWGRAMRGCSPWRGRAWPTLSNPCWGRRSIIPLAHRRRCSPCWG